MKHLTRKFFSNSAGNSVADIIWRSRAVRHLNAISEYLRQRNPSAAKKYIAGLHDSCLLLKDFPETGRRYDDRYRVLVFRNHLIFYRYDPRRAGSDQRHHRRTQRRRLPSSYSEVVGILATSLKIECGEPRHHLVEPERTGNRRLGAGEAAGALAQPAGRTDRRRADLPDRGGARGGWAGR